MASPSLQGSPTSLLLMPFTKSIASASEDTLELFERGRLPQFKGEVFRVFLSKTVPLAVPLLPFPLISFSTTVLLVVVESVWSAKDKV